MKTILLILFLLLSPAILGYGAVSLYDKTAYLVKSLKKKRISSASEADPARKNSFWGRLFFAFPIGVIMLILIAGMSNLICVFLHLDLASGTKLFAGILVAVMTLFYLVIVICIFSRVLKKLSAGNSSNNPSDSADHSSGLKNNAGTDKYGKVRIILTVLSILLSLLLLFLAGRGKVSVLKDQTVETVNSFIATGEFYSVDPLSGLPYTDGYPTRLALMCLPYFYSVLSRSFSVTPYILVWNIMPVYFLLTGMMVFYNLGITIFKKENKRIMFYFICLLLLLCTNVSFGAPGFDILHTGYRAEALLGLIILPQTFVFCLKKKWIACFLTVLAEPLIASTSFGIGACFFVAITYFIITKLPVYKKLMKRNTQEGGSR